MARWGRRGIAHWLGALLPGRRGVMRIRRRRGWRRPGAGGRFAAGSRPASGGRFVSGNRPASGGHFVAGGRTALFARPARRERHRRPAGTRMRVSSKPPRRERRKLGGMRLFLIVFLSFCVFVTAAFVYVERNLRPPLMHVATMRVKQIVTRAINEAISNHVASHANAERLVEWQKSEDGRVSGFMLNYAEHMRITSETIETVQRTLNEIKHVPEHIPIGQAIGSAVIASFGPRMPVRFEPVGAAKVELGTRQRDAGINMILVEVYIRITAEMAIIIPFDTQPETVVTEIPISYLLVVGDVPMYYYDNKGNPSGSTADHAPNIALPLPEPDKETSGEAHDETGTGNEDAVPEES
ncbi:Sporulation protein YunB [Thermobacillus xylanilyticus]|uniref:Sporulation protein YunB n=1 Tax=Thermobacillus xylanilyticus TaxID=76633 RepID=A0ABM8V225_THEXY|nr:Sporulation protein YunB [Thermobacillus xylanilyticus]